MTKLLRQRRYSEVENRMKDILVNSDKDIGVHIVVENLFTSPLLKEGFSNDEVAYTVRGLLAKGYFEPWDKNPDNQETIKLTQKGRDEWLLGFLETDKNKIFLSYSTQDGVLAGKIKKELEKLGFSVFLAHETLNISEEWPEKILLEIKMCNFFLALRTKNFLEKSFPEQECGAAIAYGKRIIPLILDTNPSTYGLLQFRQGFRFNKERVESSCEKLSEKLKEIKI